MLLDLEETLRHPECQGAGPIQLIACEPFYDEEDLPFVIGEGGSALHIFPDIGFSKSSLALSREEEWLIIDHPEDEGWLVPDDLVADWMARNISCPALDDLVLSHPLYEYLTRPDDAGHSRGGSRGELVQWIPGVPTVASIYAPEFLPSDEDAPKVNRDRGAYAEAVVQLIDVLQAKFPLEELEIGVRWMGSGPRTKFGSEAA